MCDPAGSRICRHDLLSIINSGGLETHIESHTFIDDHIGWTTMPGFNQSHIYIPFVTGMLLARDLIVGISIPSSISLPASIFTRFITHHPATNSLFTMLARLIVMCITEWAQRYLSDNRSDKSKSRSVSTQQTLSEIPVVYLYSHPVTLWRLVAHKVFLRQTAVA